MAVDIQKIANGDQRAFKSLYDQYHLAMYNVCLRMLKQEDDAVDALQETFIKVFQNIHKLENYDLLPAWIKKICVNNCLQIIEKKKKIRWEEIDQQTVLLNTKDETDLIDEAEFELNMQRIQQGISSLPEKYRIVFNLYAVEDYSHEEISQMLGIPNATSRSQYMRAKQKLVEIVKKNEIHGRSTEKIYSRA
ncbi:MAG: RNA polymerase sigma factor [Saprospiraceae bacterium]|nr:RNA polymerase sigma factor [Saprospiraceae bacterium]